MYWLVVLVFVVSAFGQMTRPAVVSNVHYSGSNMVGHVTVWFDNNGTGFYQPNEMYDVNGRKYRSITDSYFNITSTVQTVAKYDVQSSAYTTPTIMVTSATQLLNTTCPYSSPVVDGSNTTSRPSAYCCLVIDNTDDNLDVKTTYYGISYFPGTVTHKLWQLSYIKDELLISGTYSVGGNLGTFSALSVGSCSGYPFIDCSHNATRNVSLANIRKQLWSNATSGEAYMTTVNRLDGLYQYTDDWTTVYSGSYASVFTLKQRLDLNLCDHTTVSCNGTVCRYQYGLLDPLGIQGANLTDVTPELALDGTTGYLKYRYSQGYAMSITFYDIITPAEPDVSWVSARVDCVTAETQITYVNHGEAGELVVELTLRDQTTETVSTVVTAGISTVLFERNTISKACVAGGDCITVKDKCSAGAVLSEESSPKHILDTTDKTRYGFVISTLVLGGAAFIGLTALIVYLVYRYRMRPKYKKLEMENLDPERPKKKKGKGWNR